jgi:hypothetical protein
MLADQELSDQEPLVFDVGTYRRLQSHHPDLLTQCSDEALELLDSLGIACDKAKARRFQELYHALDDPAVAGDIALFRYARKLLPDAYVAEQCNRNGLLLRLWHAARGRGNDVDAFAARMVADLLAAGARWNIRNEHGETPLHLAAVAHPKTLAVLCKHLPAGALANAALFATGSERLTPLHRAARFDNGASARVLMSHGADSSSRSSTGETPREVAIRFGASSVVSALDRWHDEWQSRPRIVLPFLFEKTYAAAPSSLRPPRDDSPLPPFSTFCGSTDAASDKLAALPDRVAGFVCPPED